MLKFWGKFWSTPRLSGKLDSPKPGCPAFIVALLLKISETRRMLADRHVCGWLMSCMQRYEHRGKDFFRSVAAAVARTSQFLLATANATPTTALLRG